MFCAESEYVDSKQFYKEDEPCFETFKESAKKLGYENMNFGWRWYY